MKQTKAILGRRDGTESALQAPGGEMSVAEAKRAPDEKKSPISLDIQQLFARPTRVHIILSSDAYKVAPATALY